MTCFFLHFLVSLKDNIRSQSCIGSSGRLVGRISTKFRPNPRQPLPILSYLSQSTLVSCLCLSVSWKSEYNPHKQNRCYVFGTAQKVSKTTIRHKIQHKSNKYETVSNQFQHSCENNTTTVPESSKQTRHKFRISSKQRSKQIPNKVQTSFDHVPNTNLKIRHKK